MRATWPVLLVATLLGIGCATDKRETATGLTNGSFSANLNGFDIHYEVHGSGPVLMTVPNSWGLSLEGLRALYRPLEERLTLVYFDPRGMGRSGPIREDSDMGLAAVRDDFDALRQHLGLDRVHAIGWSNGASNLILLAAERPEILDSAIFLHGMVRFGEEDMRAWSERHPGLMEDYARFQEEIRDPSLPLEEKTRRLRKMWLDVFFPVMSAEPQTAPAMLERLFGDAEFSWAHGEYANQEAPVFDGRDKLPSITARCLVLVGAHDSFPPERTRELHDGLADSRFVVFENSGHFAPAEEPEAFRAAVFEFLGV